MKKLTKERVKHGMKVLLDFPGFSDVGVGNVSRMRVIGTITMIPKDKRSIYVSIAEIGALTWGCSWDGTEKGFRSDNNRGEIVMELEPNDPELFEFDPA